MNILVASYYYKPHIGGVENSLSHISHALMRKGHHVTILASDADLTKKQRLLEREVIEGITVYRFKRFIPSWSIFSFWSPFFDILSAAQCIAKLHERYQFDILISRNHIIGLAGGKAGIKKRFFLIPSIIKDLDTLKKKSFSYFSLKNRILLYYVNVVLNPINQYLQNRFLKKADVILVFSENLKKQLIQHMPQLTSENKIRVIHPGVNIPIIAHDNRRSDTFVFLIIGRLIQVKRVDIAIRAMAELKNKNCILKVVGEGPVKSSLEQLVSKLNLNEKVLFYNFTTDVDSFYQEADCFLMTSEYETFGQTIIEAMSFGLPIIAFNNDGIQVKTSSDEIIEHRKNGLFCAFNQEALVDAMLEIMNEDPNTLDLISTNNRSKVKERYSWDQYAIELLNLSKEN